MKKQWIILALLLLVVAGVVGLYLAKNGSLGGKAMVTDGGLKIETLKNGKGNAAQIGETVTVHYTGWLDDGTKFDSSRDRDRPFQFILGQRQVIEGWEKGVENMKEGEVRRLVIPPAMAYGEKGVGPIPPNSTLMFEVELLKTEKTN